MADGGVVCGAAALWCAVLQWTWGKWPLLILSARLFCHWLLITVLALLFSGGWQAGFTLGSGTSVR